MLFVLKNSHVILLTPQLVPFNLLPVSTINLTVAYYTKPNLHQSPIPMPLHHIPRLLTIDLPRPTLFDRPDDHHGRNQQHDENPKQSGPNGWLVDRLLEPLTDGLG